MTEVIPKMELTSLNVKDDKLSKLKALFPEVFNEDKVDFDKLRRTLGEVVDSSDERFGMNWPKKSECYRIIQEPSVGALKPCKEESSNWETTDNLFIEGDNLEVIKLLQQAYYGKVKMIYIDPPYNTGGDFIYPDDYTESLETYLKYTGQMDGNGRKYSTNSETDGRYHSKWMNMIYPRLFLSRNLLKDDGVVVIHIDEHELHHLVMMMDEIYGPENSLGEIVWDKKNPKGDAKKVSYQHETLVIYAKNYEVFKAKYDLKRPKANAKNMLKKANELYTKIGKVALPADLEEVAKKYTLPPSILEEYKAPVDLESVNKQFSDWIKKQDDLSGGEAMYSKVDENGEVYRLVSMAWPNKKKAPEDYFIPLCHPSNGKPCPVPDRGWRNPPDTMQKLLRDDLIVFGSDERTQPQRKYLLKENMFENIPSILRYGASDDALFNTLGINFENPKPYRFSQELISYFTSPNDNDIVLDFFAGSCTTAHAVMQLNYEDNGNRSFICVQLPEKYDEKSDRTIADVGKTRINKVISMLQDRSDNRGFGVRVFKLTESNFKIWDSTAPEEDIAKQIEIFIDHINPDSTEEDILFEILSKAGFPLTTKIETLTLAEKRVYSIANDALMICLEKKLSKEVITQIASKQPARVVCLDAGFEDNDQLKTNAVQIMKSHGVTDFRTV